MPSTSGFEPWWKRWCSQNKSRAMAKPSAKGFNSADGKWGSRRIHISERWRSWGPAMVV